MAAFELGNQPQDLNDKLDMPRLELDPRRIRDECIIALKVYDSCRQQRCE